MTVSTIERLRNVAQWHMEKHDLALASGNRAAAERHDMVAFALFKVARAIANAAEQVTP